mmetsp:Transcript_57715/g.91478  ORF Transcript_57715/g.91478 Transcript_57715/m.91478 type:complete len:230 (+) Transcript_57715:571-1260(+)
MVEAWNIFREEFEVLLEIFECRRKAAPHLLELWLVLCKKRVERCEHIFSFTHTNNIFHPRFLPDRYNSISFDSIFPRNSINAWCVMRLEDAERILGIGHSIKSFQVSQKFLGCFPRVAPTLRPWHCVRVMFKEAFRIAQSSDLVNDIQQPSGTGLGGNTNNHVTITTPFSKVLLLKWPMIEIRRNLTTCYGIKNEARDRSLYLEECRWTADPSEDQGQNNEEDQRQRHQ